MVLGLVSCGQFSEMDAPKTVGGKPGWSLRQSVRFSSGNFVYGQIRDLARVDMCGLVYFVKEFLKKICLNFGTG